MGCYRRCGGMGVLLVKSRKKVQEEVFVMGSRRTRKRQRVSNPALAKAMRELRRSSAASRHVLKKHKGSRSVRASRAICDSKEQ